MTKNAMMKFPSATPDLLISDVKLHRLHPSFRLFSTSRLPEVQLLVSILTKLSHTGNLDNNKISWKFSHGARARITHSAETQLLLYIVHMSFARHDESSVSAKTQFD